MNSQFVNFEEQLRSLLPSELQITRDQLIYSAGAHVGSLQAWRKCRVWSASTVVASLLIVGALGTLMKLPDVMKKGGDIVTQTQSSQPRPSNSDHDSRLRDIELQSQPSDDSSAVGFSNIHNVDSWSREELRKRGISVNSWKHALQTEEPPLNWVEITFDTTRAPANQGILMTAWLVSDKGVSEIASRTHTDAVDVKSLALLLSVGEGYRENSYVNILIWKPRTDGGSEAQGYKLSTKRMIELTSRM